LRNNLAQSPLNFNLAQVRWTLAALRQVVQGWMRQVSLVGLWRILQRFALRYKRGRLAIHSPDRHYERKRQRIAEIEAMVRAEPERLVLLYADEFTFTRQPTVANAYAPQGHEQVSADIGYRPNYEYRILAVVNALTGQVHFVQRKHIKVATLREFWRHLSQAYPQAEQIYVVLDNWPVHYHPDGLALLQAQPFVTDFIVPASWPTRPRPSIVPEHLPLVLVPLPTYASWLNPIEKLWRWLRQNLLHLHPYQDDADALKAAVTAFLDRFAQGSRQLLRYLGLLPI
jgi:hypothetical protein